MINCKQATELVLKKEDGKIGLKNRLFLWLHLLLCPLCKLFAKQSKYLSKLSKALQENEKASLTVEEKKEIIQELENTH